MNRALIIALSFIFVSCSNFSEWGKNSTTEKSSSQKNNVETAAPVAAKVVIPKVVAPVVKAKPKPHVFVEQAQTPAVSKYCKKIDKRFKKYGWGKSYCNSISWNHVRNSNKGDPLIWKVYGNEDKDKSSKDMTLILCGVHGDEITPIKFCFDIIAHLEKTLSEKNHDLKDSFFKTKLVAVAPIVSPDSFFKRRPTRTNGRGIDINRNFPTKDWKKNAMKNWINRYKRDKRRYPGKRALSEPETVFQVNLIKRYNPHKIISVHSPLTILDYDGPAVKVKKKKFAEKGVATKANQLLIQMSKSAKGYRIRNYPFFAGSLGNYAGNERGIPTFTLELPSSDNRRSKQYWRLFKGAIHTAIMHDLPREEVAFDVKKDGGNVSN